MATNTSISLSGYFAGFIARQIENGRYGSTGEVIYAGLRLLEERERRLETLRQALIEGEASGEDSPLDMHQIRRAAREEAGLDA
ncbi:type II toxin-antitoxin system ParD family antitoxin [Candidatus Thiosymbion oneisti]|uniref:type II toxin-antitoxin system ParD family antitoxin n=1 Tax=Candidatus Thiosymbion oneisti TaxID=589554 RepID=UPI000B7C70D2|nr:type II toxin-antitoxin system ParD family antitoxin [Candidatus Thiosymbion oneisti]